MKELSKKPEVSEAKKPEMNNFQAIKPESDMSVKEARSFTDGLFERNREVNDGFYSSYNDRLNITPQDGPRGKWNKERGESTYIPSEETESGRAAKEKLAEYDLIGIEYKNAEPDFSKCSEATVKIDNMTGNRGDYYDKTGELKQGNFAQADIKLAEQWNAEEKDGRTDWTAREVKDWRQENKHSWHECCDTKTMQLVPQDIHGYFNHSGGVSECKTRDKDNGGGFDE